MGRKFFFNRFHHLIRVFFWVVGSLLGLFSVFAMVLAISLSAGPIPLDFAIPYLDDYISTKDTPYKFQIESAELSWDKDNNCLNIQAKGVSIRHEDIEHHSLNLPNFQFRFHPASLLRLKFVPFEIAIVEPHIHLYQGADDQLYLTKEKGPAGETESWNEIFEGLTLANLKTLRNFKVTDLRIDIHDLKTGETWDIPRLNLSLMRHGSVINCELSVDARGAKAGGKATLELHKSDGIITGIDIDLNGQLSDLNFDDLGKFWHPKLAPVPRNWIMENLSGAKVQSADIKAGWHLAMGQTDPELILKNMGGEIRFTGMKVLYFGNLPPVEAVDGVAKYDHKNFDIKVLKGKLKDLTITGGRVFIKDMDLNDQYIDIDVDLNGPLNTALNILDEKPLNLSAELDIEPKKVKGDAIGTVHFDFPLDTAVTLDQVNFGAKTALKNVSLKKPLGDDTSTDLQNGQFMLTVDRDHMLVKGKANYGKIPTDVIWQQKFDDHPKDWKVQYEVQAKLTPENLASLGYGDYTDGPILMKATLTENDKAVGKLRTEMDLTNTRLLLPLIDTIHVPGNPALAIIEAELKHHKLQRLDKINITGKDIQISPQVKINPTTKALVSIDCPNLKLGKSELSFRLNADKKNFYQVDLTGKSLDLEALIKYLKTREFNDEPTTPFQFTCAVENAWFHEGTKSIRNLRATGYHNGESLQTCSVQGQLLDAKNKQVGELRLDQKLNGQQKEMTLTSDNAGETLDVLGLTTAVSGGELKLVLAQKPAANWLGKLKIVGFNLREAPTVTRILSIISPFGIIEVVAGKPLAFAKFSTKLVFEKDRILLQQGRAMGPSIGLNVNGIINRKNDTVDLHGTILPYNAINVFLSKVPLVSQLLGGKGGGIFGFQYGISGPIDDPTTSVNPLSVLTPGILRNVFAHPDPEEGVPSEE